MAREEFPVKDSQQKKEEKSDKQSGEKELPALIKSKDDEIIEQAQTILKSLSLASTREELEKADELLNTLIKFVDQNPLNYEMYYLLIEGLRAGGELASLLEQTADGLTNQNLIDKKIRASVGMYVMFIFSAVCFGSPLLYSCIF